VTLAAPSGPDRLRRKIKSSGGTIHTMVEAAEKEVCGIVMPISGIDGCTESHWSDVLEIITESIEDAGFSANLVSNSDEVGVIHKRIIHNLYSNPIVVCDVSGKNPNVMFELGMRLAFDKPTIIIKDEKTSYSFDTSSIEHIEYPRDLRFTKIVEFKEKLSDKISSTHKKATEDKDYTTFLKHFGEFKVAKLDQKEVSGQEFIIEELKNIRSLISRQELSLYSKNSLNHARPEINLCLMRANTEDIKLAMEIAHSNPMVQGVRIEERSPGHRHLLVQASGASEEDIRELRGSLRRAAKIPLRRPPPKEG
jgi:hypothetical protein